ncbi:helix-turn-helix domain-containing protein [Ammoniphilus sp. CFH 90114]|uniref:helix-turn-helix domain-containing protein n=1 Tax=Ammoniphilus sp. CFH 90114 TaxID=2493665 RepID=UPI00100E54DD|nr:helix-turn-helix domain-containing protein [Ammoniphilus sp. CFH 90114]RXT14892.1 helix-turn-helix domain-containing protein [Ammoniphilus sp. CFH 90114]
MILKIYRSVAQRYKAFDSKKEMDEHVRAHVFASGRKLHRNARAVLDTIARHSVAVYGVSWLNEETIAEVVKVSERTVKRAIDRLESLGVGRREVVEFQGMTLRYFVINKYDLDLTEECREDDSKVSKVEIEETPVVPTLETDSDDDEPQRNSKTQETQDQKISKDVKNVSDDTLDASYTPSNVPEQFVSVVKTFFNDAKKIYRIWGVVNSATKKLDVIQAPIETVIQAFKESVFAFKAGRVRKTLECFLYGTLLNKITLTRRQSYEQKQYISPLFEENDQIYTLRYQLNFIDDFYGVSV